MKDCNSRAILLEGNVQIQKNQFSLDAEERNKMPNVPFREAVGALTLLATVTRPDIMYAVRLVSRFLSDPGVEH